MSPCTGIPIAYPRMVFLETALESKLNPLVALGRAGSMGLSGFVNKFNADAELLDDLVRSCPSATGFRSHVSYQRERDHRTTIGPLSLTRFVARVNGCPCSSRDTDGFISENVIGLSSSCRCSRSRDTFE